MMYLIRKALAKCSMADHVKRGDEDSTLLPEATSSPLEADDFYSETGNT